MSLIKIPFIVSSTLGIHVVVSPPNPPPPSHECLKPTGIDRFGPLVPIVFKVCALTQPGCAELFSRIANLVFQSVFWSYAMLEISVIVASRNPSSPFSQWILEVFVLRPTPSPNLIITPTYLVGWCLNISGALIRLWCYRLLGQLFTFELSIRKDHSLITSGIYSVVRHPAYTGALLGGWGLFTCVLCKGSWARECTGLHDNIMALTCILAVLAVLSVTGMGQRMRKEDEMLQKEFGGQWEAWRKDVPWRLLPGVY
jgi:protein-S-isoprenylcysteine O-methyltransferase Ste14